MQVEGQDLLERGRARGLGGGRRLPLRRCPRRLGIAAILAATLRRLRLQGRIILQESPGRRG